MTYSKKLLSIILSIFILISISTGFNLSAFAESGKCGDNITWSYDSSLGLLKISGTGAMYDYNSRSNPAPYKDFDGINSIIIDDGVTRIGDMAFCFLNKAKNVKIGNSVITIGEDAFYKCENISSVDIPNSVEKIENGAFYNCSSLSKIKIGSGVKSIESNAFQICDSLMNVYIYNLENWFNIDFEAIDSNPLFYASNLYLNDQLLTDLIIPDSIYTVKNYTFFSCESIKSVKFTNAITTIGDYSFAKCKNLANVELGNSVQKIGESAFEECINLKNINIPNSVKSINYSAFSKTGLIEVKIPKNVSEFKGTALKGCPYLNKITVDKDNKTYDSRDNCNAVILTSANKLLVGCNNTSIPHTVNSISVFSFNTCEGLNEIIIPYGVNEILEGTFMNCSQLQSVTFTKNLKYIEGNTFYGCSNLTDVYFIGNQNDWDNIKIYDNTIKNANVHFVECKHKSVSVENGVAATCSTAGKNSDTICAICGITLKNGEIIQATGNHVFTVLIAKQINATCAKAGKTAVKKCANCDATTGGNVIKATGKHSYNAGVITKKPTSNKTGIMTYTCKICKTKKTSSIPKLKNASISNVVATKNGFKVTWKKVSTVKGYKIQYSTSSNFKNAKTITIKNNKTTSTTVKNLKSNKKYYVRIRTITLVNNTELTSSWSKARSVTVK